MTLEVMNAERRDPERRSKRVRERRPDEQGPGEPRTLRVADALQLARLAPRLVQHLPRQRHEPPHMVARGELRHYAAISLVHRDLRGDAMGEQSPRRLVVERDAGFIAGSLDPEDEHGADSDTISPLSSPRAACQQYASRKTSLSKSPCAVSSARWRKPACSPSFAPASTTRSPP